jgi:hypothetical protein
MGRLAESPLEVRLAATLFLVLLGAADAFAAWQVGNFASFIPSDVARIVSSDSASEGGQMSMREVPVDLGQLDAPQHRIERNLLVQDTHVHVPAYALTAAALSLIVFGLRLRSTTRSVLVAAAFGAPFADFAGLWGAHLLPRLGTVLAFLAVGGGFLMGLVYLVVAVVTLYQCWWPVRHGAQT